MRRTWKVDTGVGSNRGNCPFQDDENVQVKSIVKEDLRSRLEKVSTQPTEMIRVHEDSVGKRKEDIYIGIVNTLSIYKRVIDRSIDRSIYREKSRD